MAHKTTTGLTKLIQALQNAVVKAQGLLRNQHLDVLNDYIDDDGNPEVVKMKLPVPDQGGYREVEVPKLALVPPTGLKIDKLKMEFDVEIGGMDEADDDHGHEMSIRMSRGLFSRSTKAKCQITFTGDEAPEGLLKIQDELQKFM